MTSVAGSSPEESQAPADAPHLPDVELIDMNGRKVRFFSDVVQGKVVAMNFIFTTCKTICPPLTANFAKLQELLAEPAVENLALVSISVDPTNDTPPRLKAWGETFGAEPGWTFLTGDKRTVDDLLKDLGVFTPLKEDHSPIVLLGNEPSCRWRRVYGLAPPQELAELVRELAVPKPEDEAVAAEPPENVPARAYFGDVELVNQNGETVRFYSDLIRGKCVVIDCFFTECTGVCPLLAERMVAVQELAGDRLGKDVHLISLSVDPKNDTPERLARYAEQCGAREGWSFVSGERANIEQALGKLGLATEVRDQHSNLILVGNDRTGLWKKAFGLAPVEDVVEVVRSVLEDEGS